MHVSASIFYKLFVSLTTFPILSFVHVWLLVMCVSSSSLILATQIFIKLVTSIGWVEGPFQATKLSLTMIALFALLVGGSNKMALAEQKPTTTNHGQKAWLSLTTVGSSTTNRILLNIGCAPITNVISDTHLTISVRPYWELRHQANPNIHHTLW